MDTARNRALEAWMADHRHSSNSHAKALNSALEDLTGKPGTCDGRHLRKWRSGRVRWPNTATRKVLEGISGMSAVAFRVRATGPLLIHGGPTAEGPHVPPHSRRWNRLSGRGCRRSSRRLKAQDRMSDAERLEEKFAAVVASDHKRGGQLDIEKSAADLADSALNLQNSGSATHRVRSRLLATAASR